MTIEKAKMALEQAMEAYYSAIRSNVVNTLVESLNDNGLRVDTASMTYEHDNILTEKEQGAASEAELTAHDEAFDKVEEIFDKAADAVYTMLRKADVDDWCTVETHHYCNNKLELEVVFDGIKCFILIEHEN